MASRPILTVKPKAAPDPAMTPEPQADPSQVADDESNVTPEEQAEYDQFMQNALTLMYESGDDGGQVRPQVIDALRAAEGGGQQEGGPNPAILALANAAVTVVGQLDDSARKAGKPVSDDVLYHGGVAVIEELAEIAEAAKIHDYSEEDMTGAFAQALDMYRSKAIQDGRTSEETLKGQFAEINDAEAAGRLGDVLPGLPGQTLGEPPVQAETSQ